MTKSLVAYKGGSSDPPTMYHQKISYLTKINEGLEKAIFQKKRLPGVINCSKFQIVNPDRVSSLLLEIYDTWKHLFQNAFSKPPYILVN